MAISLVDALGISEVRLTRQSVVAINLVRRLCQNVSAYRPDCLFRTVTGFWEVTPVNHVILRTYRTDTNNGVWKRSQAGLSLLADIDSSTRGFYLGIWLRRRGVYPSHMEGQWNDAAA